MEQRDLLKEQIEQMARVLGKILADFLGLKSQGKVSQAIEISNQQFKSELDIDIDILVSLSNKELKKYLTKKRLSNEFLETITEYLIEITSDPSSDNYTLLNTALHIIEIVDNRSNSISFNRIKQKEKIQTIIKALE